MLRQQWHKIIFSHSQITTGNNSEMMDMFNKIFMKLGAPQNFALFSEIPKSGSPYKAVQVWEYCPILLCNHLIFR
jgi:hypothetical protein